MSDFFTQKQMEKVKENFELWWEGKSDRPIIALKKKIKDTSSEKPPFLSQANCADFSLSPEDIINRADRELASYEYIGDAFPFLNLDSFGPGVGAAFLGAKLDNSSGAVWFYPPDNAPDIEDLHIEYDPNNIWAARVKDICAAGVKKWKGNVLVGFPDFGGTIDILASFRTTEQMLFDLYDSPEEVKRLVNEIHTAWHKMIDDFENVLIPQNGGYTDWNGIYSNKKSYILQCDFGFMLSNDMFREFAFEEIKKTAGKLGRASYHLDGKGCLKDLKDILTIDEIGVVQWVPGAGTPHGACWIDTYREILASGKNAQIVGEFNHFEEVAEALGTAKGLYFIGDAAGIEPKRLEKFGL